MNEDMERIISHERYTLTLRHEYVDTDGQPHCLEEPIVVRYYVPHINEEPSLSSAIVINNMMEQMRMYMIEKGGKNEN